MATGATVKANKSNGNEQKKVLNKKDNYNVLSVLLAAEGLKPYAQKKRIELSEDEILLCKAALSILKKDNVAYKTVYEQIEADNNANMGVLADKLREGEKNEGTGSDELMESFSNKSTARETATIRKRIVDPSFKALMRNTAFAVESLERAIKNGSWSVLDAEKAIRCISYAAEPVPREISKKLYGSNAKNSFNGETGNDISNGSVLATLARRMDDRLKDDIYVVSRRLTMKYYGSNTLDQLDGILAINAATGRTTEFSILAGLKFRFDPESGLRYLTPDGMVGFSRKFKGSEISKDCNLVIKGGSNNQAKDKIEVSLDVNDQILVENAIKKSGPEISRIMARTSLKETQESSVFLNKVLEGIGCKPIAGDKDWESLKNIGLSDDEIARLDLLKRIKIEEDKTMGGLYSLSLDDLLDKSQKGGDLDQIYEMYTASYIIFQNLKDYGTKGAITASFEDDEWRQEASSSEKRAYPYDALNPLQSRSPDDVFGLIIESVLATLRIRALPLEKINVTSDEGEYLKAEAEKIKTRCEKIAANMRGHLERELLSKPDEEIRKILLKSLKGKRMKPSLSGWFKNNKYQSLFAEHAAAALMSIAEIEDADILYRAIQILDQSTGSSVSKGDRKTPQKMKLENGESAYFLAPPPKEFWTASIRLRLLTGGNIPVSIDEAAKDTESDGTSAPPTYYDRTGTCIQDVISECADAVMKTPSKGRSNIDNWNVALSGYNKTMEIINAIKAAGGGSLKCVKEMEAAEKEAKEMFIKDYLVDIGNFRKTMELIDTLGPSGEEAEESFSKDYMEIGKGFGEEVLKRLSDRVLSDAGVTRKIDALLRKTEGYQNVEVTGTYEEKNRRYREIQSEIIKKATGSKAATTAELREYLSNSDNFSDGGKEEAEKALGWSEAADEILGKLEAATDYTVSELATAITRSGLEKIAKDVKYIEEKKSLESTWYRTELKKGDNSHYGPILAGTLPCMTNESLRSALTSQIPDYSTARGLSELSMFDKVQVTASQAFNNYKQELENDRLLKEKEIEQRTADFDIQKAWDDIMDLRKVLITWDGSDQKKAKVEELLLKLSAHNPQILDRIEEFRSDYEAMQGANRFEMMRFSGRLKDLELTTKFTQYNKDLRRGYLIEKEEENAKQLKEQAVRDKKILDEKKKVDVEDEALINIAFTTLFSTEKSLVRQMDTKGMTPDDIYTMQSELSKAITRVQETSDEDLYAETTNAIVNGFCIVNNNRELDTPISEITLPRTERIDQIVMPTNGQKVQIDDTGRSALIKDGFIGALEHKKGCNLRSPKIARTLIADKETVSNETGGNGVSRPFFDTLARVTSYEDRYKPDNVEDPSKKEDYSWYGRFQNGDYKKRIENFNKMTKEQKYEYFKYGGIEALKVFAKIVNDELKEINLPLEQRKPEYTDEEAREKVVHKQRKLEKKLRDMINEKFQGRR